MVGGAVENQEDILPGKLSRQGGEEDLKARRIRSRHDQIDASPILRRDRAVQIDVFAFKGFGLLIFVPLVAAFVFWVFSILIEYALSEYAEPTTTFYIIVSTIALILGIAFHWIRDHLNLPAYAVIEIGVGMATAAQFARSGDPLVRVLAFLAGVRIIVDGTSRFLK